MPKSAVTIILNPTLYADPAIWRSCCKMFSKICPVLCDQAFDVLQKECPWAFGGQRGANVIDDQPAALGITRPLPSAHLRERWARKTSNMQIMVWELPW